MKLLCLLMFVVLFLLVFPPPTDCTLEIDKRALLQFASIVPHGRKLNWRASTPICSSWVGITCSSDNSSVTAVRLPGVGLRGAIPSNTLGRLNSLAILSLRSNDLSGTLPNDVLSLPSLQYVFLQHNSLSGNIPSSLSPQLVALDLSFNSFTGPIPSSIQNQTHLTRLFLQNNSLTGPIPKLNVQSLQQLDLSNNHLNGSIPSSLRRFPNSSFQGNDGLCGPPLKQCPGASPAPAPAPVPAPSEAPAPHTSPSQAPSPSPSSVHVGAPPPNIVRRDGNAKKKLSKVAVIAIAVGGAAALSLLLLAFFCCLRKKGDDGSSVLQKGFTAGRSRNEKPNEQFSSGVQEAEKNKLVFFEGCSLNFDLEDLLRASAEVLGKGSYGTTYKATLEDGTTVVVKRLKDVVVGRREFEQQMEMIGNLGHHANVVPLRAYYYSKDEKLLVYDYMTNGSLFARLHGSRDDEKPPLDWESRVKILLGCAKGIAHIHSAGGSRFTHGNLKSSNILLTQDLNGCVSDFGLAPLMSPPSIPPRTAGYRAPEAIDARKTSQKSDVYSFGVVLLELLTGKSPVQSPGCDNVEDLPRWVQSVLREEWTAEVFDVDLMKNDNIEEELVQMLQVAMSCVAKVSDARPDMAQVVRMIEEIRHLDSSNRTSSPEGEESEPKPPSQTQTQ